MRIVFVSDAIYPYMHGGKEKRLYEISTRLAQRGHDVHIYTMHWWKTPEKIHLENGVQLHALCKRYEMYKGDRRTIKEGILFGLACLKLFFVQFDVLDVDHMPFFPVLSSWLVCTLRGKKFYGTWHEALTRKEWTDYMGLGGNIAAFIEKICIQLPYAITAASDHTYRLLKSKRNKVQLVTPGIDYAALQMIQPASEKCDVLTVCRLVKDKNVCVLIKAISVLARDSPKISCIIVGKGPERQHLMKQVDKLRLNKNIVFIERLPEAHDVYAYMKAATVFCLPSIREGFGIAVLEALGCNTPVITIDSPTNASRNLINEGQNGSIVTNNANDIANAIQHWLVSPKPNDIAGAIASYDWDNLVKEQERVYAV